MKRPKIIRKRFELPKNIKNFLLPIFAVIVSFILNNKFTLYIIFIIITAVIVYYTKLYHLPWDLSPLFFLQIVITRYYNIKYTLFFILLGYIVPKLVAGRGMKWDSYAFVTLSIICNIISVFMKGMPLQTVGYLTSIIQYVGGIFIGVVTKPFIFAAADGVANVANNIMYFLIFTNLIVFILG